MNNELKIKKRKKCHPPKALGFQYYGQLIINKSLQFYFLTFEQVGLKIHKGKTKYTTNHADSEEILDQQEIEKVTEFKYLGQNTHHKRHYKGRNICQDQSSTAVWSCFGKKKKQQQQGNTPR